MRRTYISTDWHCNHGKILQYENRPADFTKRIIVNHSKILTQKDILIVLGDVWFNRISELKEAIAQIDCKKFLIKGNHDHKSVTWYMRNGFDWCGELLVMHNILFSHKPQQRLEGTDFNVHGHFHKTSHKIEDYEWYDKEYHRGLSIEYAEYKPILLEKFLFGDVKNEQLWRRYFK